MPSNVTLQLTGFEIDMIIESLQYTKQAKENYDRYPSYEFKRAQVAQVEAVLEKLRTHRRLSAE